MLRRAADPHRRGDPARGVRATRDVASRAGLAPRALPGLGAGHPGACRPGAGRRRRGGRGVAGARPAGVRTPGGRGLRRRVRQRPGLAGLPRVRRRVARPRQREHRPAPVGGRAAAHRPARDVRRSPRRELPQGGGPGARTRAPGAGHRGRADGAVAGLGGPGRAGPVPAPRRRAPGDVRSGRARRRGRHRPRARPDRRGCRRAGAADPGRCRPAAARRRLVRGRGARLPPAVGTRRRHPARARRPLRRRSREPGVRRVLPGGPRALPGVRER